MALPGCGWRQTTFLSTSSDWKTTKVMSSQLVGEAGTHELRIGRIGLELTASRFELLSNELGDVDVDAIATSGHTE